MRYRPALVGALLIWTTGCASGQLDRKIDDNRLRTAYGILEAAIEEKVFPGAQVAIVRRGKLIASRGIGRLTYARDAARVTPHTLYDLASVTKVAATTLTAMCLWDAGKLDLDRPIKTYLPAFKGGDRDRVTLRHLLTHTSGLPPWVHLWKKVDDPAAAVGHICKLGLRSKPGEKKAYSDLGLILLGNILESVTKTRLDRLAQRLVFKPMGLENTMFKPPARLRPHIAPTEIGGGLNRGLIHGEVHDENAHFLGGVAPHAGLFSTAEDLAALSQMLINGGTYGGHRFFKPRTVKAWTRRQNLPKGSTRALGWDTPADRGSLAGDRFSPGSFGHTGFTGTSMWIDPNRRIAVILLTNRVHPTRKRGGIGKVRRAFHDEVMRVLLEKVRR